MVYRSRPARALWIEISHEDIDFNNYTSRPARALWIEMAWYRVIGKGGEQSRPARALWIEIVLTI